MANAFVQVPPNSTGKMMQTFENLVGGNTVDSEAVTLVRSSDNTEVGTSGSPVRVDPTGTTVQPVSGTVTANVGTTNGLALDATLTGGTAVAIAKGGAKGTTAAAVLTSNPIDANTQALHVDGSKVTQPVSGTFWQATQPVSGTFWQATQPVSGTVTSNAGTGTFGTKDAADMTGTTPGAAPSNTLIVGGIYNASAPTPSTGQTLPVQFDASGNLKVNMVAGGSGGSNAAAGATGAAVPASADYTGFNSGGNLVGVSSANPLPVSLANTGANATAVKVDGSAVTQPVSGTVTANVGTTNGLALDATLTGGNLVAIAKGGAKGTTAAAVLTSNPVDANTQALHVDGSKVTQPVSGTVTANAGSGTFAVSGTVTANQGTAAAAAGKWPVQITDGTNTMPTGDASARTIHVTADNATLAVTQSGTWTDRIVGNAGGALDAAQNAAAPANELVAGGVYNTTIPALTAGNASQIQVDSTGSQYVNTEGRKATYSCFATFTPVAGDVAVMPGSASKTIRVTRVEVSLSTSGTAALEQVQLIKRSAADTAGTSAGMTAVPHDSNFSAATAAPLSYTAAPTPGAAVGTLRGVQFNDASASVAGANTWLWTFGDRPATAIALRGTAQQLCVNVGGVVATQTATVSFEWTEE